MLILLPPSESKVAPRSGRPLDLADLSFPVLTGAREKVLAALLALCTIDDAAHRTSQRAVEVLGLGPSQRALVDLNARLLEAPTARADRVYSGVLYDALDVASLSTGARRRAARRVAVTSSVFGLVRTGDRIPAYRLSGDTTLPGLGPVAGAWRTALGPAVREAVGDGLLVDLRSSTYAAFWRPPSALAGRVATVRVLHEVNGRRRVASHSNKVTKGRLVRTLLEDGGDPRSPGDLADVLRDLGWSVEEAPTGAQGARLDVVVGEA